MKSVACFPAKMRAGVTFGMLIHPFFNKNLNHYFYLPSAPIVDVLTVFDLLS